MKRLSILFYVFSLSFSWAQTGTIKGQVLDQQSQLPLIGATVELLNAEVATGVITNDQGYYTLENVPLGRQSIRISYIGYESVTIPNIVVNSGKDAIANTSLIESFDELDAIVLTAETNKDRPVNEMAGVSARQFSLEEVNRFSGGRSDVGRLAANFAGVSAPDDSRNDIVVRGNSPTGLLWRLEGVPIPSPNHFGTIGTTGGPVSALNTNMLANSDFLTSAFPAEYGNALGGVFDLGFRKGNMDDYEFTAQVGVFTGVEAMAEGPLGKKDGSFLVAGRYSLIGLLGAGAGGTAAVPNYSDLSYHLDFGNGKWGNFSIFGIIGTSDIDFLGDEIDEDDLFAAEDEDSFVKSGFSVFGLKHQITIGDRSYLKSVLSFSESSNTFEADRYLNKDTPQEDIVRWTETDDTEKRIALSSVFNSKLSRKTTLRAGVVYEGFKLKSFLRDREGNEDQDGDGIPDLLTFRNSDDTFNLLQPFVQGQFRLSKKFTLNAGLHGQYSDLNDEFVFEPRASLNYQVTQNQSLEIGYGIHHQNVPLPILFLNENINGEMVQTNRNLDFIRSQHFVLGYDLRFAKDWRAKLEIYYQDITDAAVEPFPSSYSTLTEGADFEFSNDKVSLVNEGTGYNQGLELTVEKFFSKGYYGLLTASLFESKYEGSDGIERNTPFNNGYVFNVLAGREIAVGSEKRNALFFDTRLSFAGGRYFTPIDLEASQAAGTEILIEEEAYTLQYDDYFRWDLKFGFKLNSKRNKQSHQFYVDLQNLTNRENVFVQRYNRLTNQVDQINQIGFFPDFGYRFQF